jgi:hypothetical protein
MPVPMLPYIVQVNWLDTNDWPMWEQTYANVMASTLHDIDFTTQGMAPAIGRDTCKITCEDPARIIVPEKASSVLFPYVVPEVRVRVLSRDPNNMSNIAAEFFGMISEYSPTPTKELPRMVSIIVESPIRKLLGKSFELPRFNAGTAVLNPDDPGASPLGALLAAAEILNTPFVQLDTPTRMVGIPVGWGGGKSNFGQALAELLALTHSVMILEPQYAVANGDPDWVLHWKQPTPASFSTTWTVHDIGGGSTVTFGDEQPAA